MDIINYPLSHYSDAEKYFHIHQVVRPTDAKNPHTHHHFQVYYVTNGSLVHYVENKSSTLSRGDMFIIPPDRVHYIVPNPDVTFYSFSFLIDFLEEAPHRNSLVLGFLHKIRTEQTQAVPPKLTIASEDIFYIESIMEHILKEFRSKKLGYEETIRAYTVVLTSLFARSYFQSNTVREPLYSENNEQYVLRCIEYIKNNYKEPMTLDEIAKRSTMSRGRFCSLFYKLTGYSFHTYLNMCRIKRATEYIKNGYKITVVYGLCGYNHYSSFHRNFKKIMGIAPEEYKKAHVTK